MEREDYGGGSVLAHGLLIVSAFGKMGCPWFANEVMAKEEHRWKKGFSKEDVAKTRGSIIKRGISNVNNRARVCGWCRG